jgi:hypothetical protein
MGASFESPEELREVMDRVFAMMDEDPEMGPRLQAADLPQRYEFTDAALVVNLRAARLDEPGHLHWEWSDDVAWQARVSMSMSSEIANRYFQGEENVAVAIARRRITPRGDVAAALALLPLTQPVHARYRAMVERDYPHLAVSGDSRQHSLPAR